MDVSRRVFTASMHAHRIFHAAWPAPIRALAEMEEDAARACVLRQLEAHEAEPGVEDDATDSAGLAAAEVEHPRMDGLVLAWVEDVPSTGRLQAAGTFLGAYWGRSRLEPTVWDVGRLVAAAAGYDARDAGWRSTAEALYWVSARRALSPFLRRTLVGMVQACRDDLEATGASAALLERMGEAMRRLVGE